MESKRFMTGNLLQKWGAATILRQHIRERLVDYCISERKAQICCAHGQRPLTTEEERVGHFTEHEPERKRRGPAAGWADAVRDQALLKTQHWSRDSAPWR